MSRLDACLAKPGKKLIAYLTCGDPSVDASVDIVCAAVAAGADIVELGVPFSEPSADGPVIQRAMMRALSATQAQGALPVAFEVVRRVRAAGCAAPIILFGYFNPIFVMGVERFCGQAAAAGVDGCLVVDLPLEEVEELARPARAAGLALIPLLAPTSTPERIARTAALGAAFVYYVSMTGVTGAALSHEGIREGVARVRTSVTSPIAVGFGVASPDDARRVAQCADAVVVGSAIVRAIEANPGREAAAVTELVGALRAAL